MSGTSAGAKKGWAHRKGRGKTSSGIHFKNAQVMKKSENKLRKEMFGANAKRNTRPKKQKTYTDKSGVRYLGA